MNSSKIMGRRPPRAVAILAVVVAAILGVLLVTGCSSGSGGLVNEANKLMQEYPWLDQLGLSFIESLVLQYGTNILAVLAAALAAL
jgi:anaerobic C4-dicarboxylate transporter